MWHANEISIADEHAATAITESILTVLAERQTPASPVGRKVVATTVGGEQHSIGLRIVALAFELAGWDCLYIGADVPHPDVQAAVSQHRADVLAVSCTSRLHLRSVAELINLVRRADENPPKILVGGRAFIAFPELWGQVGADRVALDAFEGVRIANELTSASSA
jgi:methanogenic corrinoid protein MtbC1